MKRERREREMVGLADMSSVSKENIEVMEALIGNFTLYDDVNKVYDILKGHRKLSLLCEEKQENAKNFIRQLTKQVEELEEKKKNLKDQNEEEMRKENEKLKKEVSGALLFRSFRSKRRRRINSLSSNI